MLDPLAYSVANVWAVQTSNFIRLQHAMYEIGTCISLDLLSLINHRYEFNIYLFIKKSWAFGGIYIYNDMII